MVAKYSRNCSLFMAGRSIDAGRYLYMQLSAREATIASTSHLRYPSSCWCVVRLMFSRREGMLAVVNAMAKCEQE